MSTRIDGIVFEKMMLNARNNLFNQEDDVNALNVFPVADGDTGTNMRLTVENGIRTAKSSQNLGTYLKGLGEGMLLGARGNSGVILSQIFYGFAQALIRYPSANASELRNAFIRGYKTAYASVNHPVEGTILTVSREGVENIRNQVDRTTTVESFFGMFIAEMKKSLNQTPELLDVLKEAGVVDSGAFGFIILTEGMLKELQGETITSETSVQQTSAPAGMYVPTEEQLKHFDGTTPFEEGYCMEFLLQLMKGKNYVQSFRLDQYLKVLETLGNSIVAVQNGTIVKVHIHTFRPAKIITFSQKFGEFVAFKLENMQLQHNEHMEKMEKRKQEVKHVPLSVIAVADGEGFRQLFEELHVNTVLDGGASMNTSAQEFVGALKDTNADRVLIFPNNKNIIRAAEQAVQITGMENVTVMHSSNMMECYYAMAMDMGNNENTDERIASILGGMESAAALYTACASKAYEKDGIIVHKGDDIALIDDEVVFASEDSIETIREGLKKIKGIEDRAALFALYGEETPEDEGDLLAEMAEEEFPDLELTVMKGGQHVYRWIIGVL